MWRSAALSLAALVALAGCTTATQYGPADAQTRYGYSEERLDDSTWRVKFAGNSATPRERVEDLLLFRAAELARSQEARSFVVLEQSVDRSTSYRGTVLPSFGFRSHAFLFHGHPRSRYLAARRYGAFPLSPIGTANLTPIDRFTAFSTVRLYPDEPPGGLGVPYDVDQVLETLGPRVAPPAEGDGNQG